MKIQCQYCGNMINDTLEKCPHCGAPNEGVVRKSGNQPITIEELKKWYQDRALPPYETTRFFIGIDYKKPRAFGIYKDPKTGNYVVYKNKANGQRAIRYAGKDEAYAVNELYQRLKEEIIQQKRANLNRQSSGSGKHPEDGKIAQWFSRHRILRVLVAVLGLPFLIYGCCYSVVRIADPPKEGYYLYDSTYYYTVDAIGTIGTSVNTMFWYVYDEASGDWEGTLTEGKVPDDLERNRKARKYYLSKEWSSEYGVPGFEESEAYGDLINGFQSRTGYYSYEDQYYYHLYENTTYGWYTYDVYEDDWEHVYYDEIPEVLQHSVSSQDFYYSPEWDASTQITDFMDSEVYEELQASSQSSSSSSWDNDDDDSSYDWSSDSDWDSDYTDWDSDW